MNEQRTPDAMSRLEGFTPKDWLVRCHHLCRRMHKYRGMPLWAFISDITSHGSGYSVAICKHFGWDPHAPANRKIL